MQKKYETYSIHTNINGGRHGGSSYDHTRKISEFVESKSEIELISTDTVYVPRPHRNSDDYGDLITTISYKKNILKL